MHIDDENGRPAVDGGSRRRLRFAGVLLAALLVGVGGVACSDDSSDDADVTTTVAGADDGDSPDDGGSTPDDGGSTPDDEGESPDDEGDGNEGEGEGDGDGEITSEEICAAVSTDAIAEATGLEVTGAEPSDGSTPQCAYTYVSPNGPDSNLTVAATRYTDSDAQSIEQAFDSAVQINLATVGGDAEQTEVDAGDEAVILTGPVLTMGVLRVGDILASLIVAPDTLTPDQTEATMVAIGAGFG